MSCSDGSLEHSRARAGFPQHLLSRKGSVSPVVPPQAELIASPHPSVDSPSVSGCLASLVQSSLDLSAAGPSPGPEPADSSEEHCRVTRFSHSSSHRTPNFAPVSIRGSAEDSQAPETKGIYIPFFFVTLLSASHWVMYHSAGPLQTLRRSEEAVEGREGHLPHGIQPNSDTVERTRSPG